MRSPPTTSVQVVPLQNATTETQQDWYRAHEELGTKAREQIAALQTELGSRFVPFHETSTTPSFQQLEERLDAALRHRGLIMVGDSTTRFLYGFLWCLLEGLYRNESTRSGACGSRQESLKEHCKNSTQNDDSCEWRAIFSNTSRANLVLQHIPNYHLGRLEKVNMFASTNFTNKTIFVGMPCLHSLWSPGSRERYVRSKYRQWPERFQQFYRDLEMWVPSSAKIILSPTMALCNEKLGDEKKLIDLYLHDADFPLDDDASKTKHMLDFYNRHGYDGSLPANYTGRIPVRDVERANHSLDASLFDEAGALECTRANVPGWAWSPGMANQT